MELFIVTSDGFTKAKIGRLQRTTSPKLS
jgi:hypothetical protein